ncbi:SGNH/GDSL hydrolase family protein [Lacticaseibacillus hegangensis]|uniref:SGNH/GDSL hydrolase family protein n=1 Tax=Lacticaseibacillus hegangensis TaxID=2486010 RepID=A0ABW4CZX4_9LACO|nr:SGNH/GDSL hydrolase family protein [Lacticaseibacillus hegangensis]
MKKHWWLSVLIVLASAVVTFLIWQVAGPKAQPIQLKGQVQQVKTLRLAAVGDSLTHGVGDETNNGGYVGLIQADLESSGVYQVDTSNYGVTGDTSTQILKRVNKQKKLRTDVEHADILTVTVGGNDLMHVLQKNLLSISTKDVTDGAATYQRHLTSLLTALRQLNPKAPVYVFGVYNPFYVYFPNLTAMSTSVKTWNNATQAALGDFDHMYYVDIDSVLTKGTGTQANSKSDKAKLESAMSGSSKNPLIFESDHFHPNNAGYALMTSQLWKKMQATKQSWEK